MFEWLRNLEVARRRMNVDASTVRTEAYHASVDVLPYKKLDFNLMDEWDKIPATLQHGIIESVRKEATERVTKLVLDKLSAEIGAEDRLIAMRNAVREADVEFVKLVDGVSCEIENVVGYLIAALRDNGHVAMAARVRSDIDRAFGRIRGRAP